MATPIRPNEQLPERVLGFIRRHSLTAPGETVVVGVSGGPDSVCLVHVLVGLQEGLGMGLHLVHLNHMLRGAESDGDADYVRGLAQSLGLPCTLESRDVRSYHQTAHRQSLEETARQVRYQVFAEVAEKAGAGTIAVGHTADDQVETILMRLLRGAGALGLQGMQPLTGWDLLGGRAGLKIIRPLLEVRREEVEAYCLRQGLSPRKDSSNLSRAYLRNRIRHDLVPLLRSYNPRIDDALLRTADTLASEQSFFEQQVSLVWDRVVSREGNAVVLEATAMKSLHPALQRHLLRRVVRTLLGSLEDIEWQHIEKMRLALALHRGKRLILPRGLVFHVENGQYRVTAE
ncbi:MAG: tRNA lysidine(34) synthetase TilS [Chloroflexi bacterium]|nr:tRNA lysidine(34) synthetase TilS [Chloroflexota bacterium]